MPQYKSDFFSILSKEPIDQIPLYCTGYPELAFIENYIKHYDFKINQNNCILNDKNYDVIDQMGFDAI